MSLLNYVPHAPSRLTCLTCLRALRIFAPYVHSCLTRLRALRALLTRFTLAPWASLRALFVHVKIVLGWIFSPAKTYHFPRIIKGTTNCAIFK